MWDRLHPALVACLRGTGTYRLVRERSVERVHAWGPAEAISSIIRPHTLLTCTRQTARSTSKPSSPVGRYTCATSIWAREQQRHTCKPDSGEHKLRPRLTHAPYNRSAIHVRTCEPATGPSLIPSCTPQRSVGETRVRLTRWHVELCACAGACHGHVQRDVTVNPKRYCKP